MTPQSIPKFSFFEHFADGQMFLCNMATQQECLAGRLFGSPRNKWTEVQKITKNTAIFLYTIGEQPTIHGIFTAVGPPFLDMDTNAFGGRFPSQVRVKLFYKFPAIPAGKVTKMFRDRNRQRRLTRQQTHEILASVISYVYKQRDAGILDRLSKQHKPSRGDVPVQPKIMNSGTPVYIYNPKNCRVSFAKRNIPAPPNSNGAVLPPVPALAFQPIALGEYKPPPLFPLAKTPFPKPGVVALGGQRKVLTTGFAIAQAYYLPQFLYFPVLAHKVHQPPQKILLQKKRTNRVTKLFAGNLHKSITNNDLRTSFSNFGNILDSGIQKNSAGVSMGSGWVEFENPTEAARAIERINGMRIAGLAVIVCPWSDGIVQRIDRHAHADNAL